MPRRSGRRSAKPAAAAAKVEVSRPTRQSVRSAAGKPEPAASKSEPEPKPEPPTRRSRSRAGKGDESAPVERKPSPTPSPVRSRSSQRKGKKEQAAEAPVAKPKRSPAPRTTSRSRRGKAPSPEPEESEEEVEDTEEKSENEEEEEEEEPKKVQQRRGRAAKKTEPPRLSKSRSRSKKKSNVREQEQDEDQGEEAEKTVESPAKQQRSGRRAKTAIAEPEPEPEVASQEEEVPVPVKRTRGSPRKPPAVRESPRAARKSPRGKVVPEQVVKAQEEEKLAEDQETQDEDVPKEEKPIETAPIAEPESTSSLESSQDESDSKKRKRDSEGVGQDAPKKSKIEGDLIQSDTVTDEISKTEETCPSESTKQAADVEMMDTDEPVATAKEQTPEVSDTTKTEEKTETTNLEMAQPVEQESQIIKDDKPEEAAVEPSNEEKESVVEDEGAEDTVQKTSEQKLSVGEDDVDSGPQENTAKVEVDTSTAKTVHSVKVSKPEIEEDLEGDQSDGVTNEAGAPEAKTEAKDVVDEGISDEVQEAEKVSEPVVVTEEPQLSVEPPKEDISVPDDAPKEEETEKGTEPDDNEKEIEPETGIAMDTGEQESEPTQIEALSEKPEGDGIPAEPEVPLEVPAEVLDQEATPKEVPESEVKEPEGEVKEPEAEVKEPEVEVQEPAAEVKEPEVEVQEPEAEVKEPEAEAKEPEVEVKEPVAEAKEPEAEVGQPEIQQPEPAEELPQVQVEPEEEPVNEPKEEPSVQTGQPVEQSEESAEKPMELAEVPIQAPTDVPVEQTAEEPTGEPQKAPAEDFVDLESPKEEPVEQTEEPVEKCLEPAEESAAEPVGEQKTPEQSQPCASQVEGQSKETGDETPMDIEESACIIEDPVEAVLKEYVVIEMNDVPGASSDEVTDSLPREHNQTPEEVTAGDDAADQPISQDQVSDGPGQCSGQENDSAASCSVQVEKITPAQPVDQTATGSQDASKEIQPVKNAETEQTSEENGTVKQNDISPNITHQNGNSLLTEDLDPLLSRLFIRNKGCDSTDPAKHFTIASYNILANCHIKPEEYQWVAAEYINMDYRHKRLLQEVEYLNADVVCLQEVDPEYYQNILESCMQGLGYSGIYRKRANDRYHEGEATFYRTAKFKYITHTDISLKELAAKDMKGVGLDEKVQGSIEKSLESAAVLQIIRLQSLSTDKILTLGNIHVDYTNFSNPSLQCIQVASAMRELESVAGGTEQAYVLAGDFNCWPGTPVYQLTKEGYLNDESVATLQAQTNVQLPDGQRDSLVNLWWKGFQHTSGSLKSAYNTVLGKEPVTSHTPTENNGEGWSLDYIWFNSHSLDVSGILETPPLSVLKQPTGGIPSIHFPSDHLSLKAELVFK